MLCGFDNLQSKYKLLFHQFYFLNIAASPPLNIMSPTLNPDAKGIVMVTWLEPNMPNGIISHYNVSLKFVIPLNQHQSLEVNLS